MSEEYRPEITNELAEKIKRTLIELAEDQYQVKITVTQPKFSEIKKGPA